MAGFRCTSFTPNTLASRYKAKDVLPKESTTHPEYSVRCMTCGEEYVGETLRALSVCRKKHKDAIHSGHS